MYNSYRKPLNKFQKVKRDRDLEIVRLKKEKEERDQKEKERIEQETLNEKLQKVKLIKSELERNIKDEQEKMKHRDNRLTYINRTYTLQVLKTKIDDFKERMKLFVPGYEKLIIEQHFKSEYDELWEAYEVIKTPENETELKQALESIC
jgi:hypothetical protein